MFTGLVEGIGRVDAVEPSGTDARFTIKVPDTLLENGACQIGESVAINGCCLTAVQVDGSLWTFQAGTETLSKTALGSLTENARVNLERALPAQGRFGGHIVQGHVDGVGTVESIEQTGEWVDMAFAMPGELAMQLVPKGSVAVDGISLTVVEATSGGFSVALIPHTLSETTLGERGVGDPVNLETDIIGKYIHRWLAAREEPVTRQSPRNDTE